jgi:hypothetical protein
MAIAGRSLKSLRNREPTSVRPECLSSIGDTHVRNSGRPGLRISTTRYQWMNCMTMNRNMITKLLLALAGAAMIFTGCEKEDERGVSRLQVGSAAQSPQAQQPGSMDPAGADSSIPKHAAPPLSQLVGSNPHGADATTTGSGADADMMVQAGETKVMAGGNILQVAGLAFTVSETWENVKASNPVRVAEYRLNGSGGPAEMAVFYFGKNQGGGLEDNIRRWAGQFSDTSTTSPGAQVARIERDGLRIALVKTEGTYNPGSMGPMAPQQGPKENFALFGLVVEGGPEGSVFIKVTGPKATLAEQDADLEKMAQSVRISEYR